MRDRSIRVVQYGLGPIGLASARLVLEKAASRRVVLVGAIDIDPSKAGRTVGALTGLPCDVVVKPDAGSVLHDARPDVVLHTTRSFLPQVVDQLTLCMRAGAHVVSTTEELLYPFERHAVLTDVLDRTAREHNVTLLGTGVNPGYAMDTLALVATGICTNVRSIHVDRCVDAGKRRLPLQKKVGAGLSEADFFAKRNAGGFGHIGLVESLRLVMAGLNWSIEELTEILDPVLAPADVTTPYLEVKAGQVAGIRHMAAARSNGRIAVQLDLRMYVGAEDVEDRVRVEGTPPINLVVEGGIFGDTATVGALFNAIPFVLDARPGLRTVADLPAPRAFAC